MSKYNVPKVLHQRCILFPWVEFMYVLFTHMPGESYWRRIRSLLYLLAGESYCRQFRSVLLCSCDVFRVLINSLCWFYRLSALGLILFQIITAMNGFLFWFKFFSAERNHKQKWFLRFGLKPNYGGHSLQSHPNAATLLHLPLLHNTIQSAAKHSNRIHVTL